MEKTQGCEEKSSEGRKSPETAGRKNPTKWSSVQMSFESQHIDAQYSVL